MKSVRPDYLKLYAITDDGPNLVERVRLALETHDAADGIDAAAFEAAAARVAPALPALRKAADADDPAAGLLLGRALLLGLGAPQDVPAGYQRILKASLDGFQEADLVFGDLLASDVRIPDLRAESRIERDRRAVAAWRHAAGPDARPTPLVRNAADRIAPMLRSGRGIPPMNNDYPQWLGRLAAAGHVPSLVALATPGGFASDDPAEALKWLRILSRTAGADPALRAWAQFRMAGMFEHGEGTPASASAARKAYERAAEGGNGAAMIALADRLAKGKPADRAAAKAWRKRAVEAEPVPEIPIPTVLVEPPTSADGPRKKPSVRRTSASPSANGTPAHPHGVLRLVPSGGANRAAPRPPVPRSSAASPAADDPLVPLTGQPADSPPPSKAGTKAVHPGGRPAARPSKPAKKHAAP